MRKFEGKKSMSKNLGEMVFPVDFPSGVIYTHVMRYNAARKITIDYETKAKIESLVYVSIFFSCKIKKYFHFFHYIYI